MRQIFNWALPVLLLSVLFTACSKDDDDAVPIPDITGIEVGSDNSKVAYVGSDIHIEAQITAQGNIASVRVEIHPEAGEGWKFDSVYTTGFVGLKSAGFHKHIDIPEDAVTGAYHLHFTVTDQRGQKKEFEEEIVIKNDPSLPSITTLDLELEDGGAELHLETDITAPNKIASVEVEIHGPWEKEFSFTDAEMVDKTTYHFHKHLDISAAPKGHYHVHLKVIDRAGKEKEFEDHFDKP
ncbi:DUF4625 domain-containing protein [Pseudoflavitalea rhizosphaerae]|uniref:DUF4625 domain-containing protein n=1 Tax=Pseudoflavitalea rhizosphaerae TaxID=1884793 RepID=UPI0013DF2B09|nr:DUF4625 domain-containing protein [Pseudoflavitalea rhizosphaerae]